LVQLVSDFAINDKTIGAIPVYLYVEETTSLRYFQHGPEGVRRILAPDYAALEHAQSGRGEANTVFWASHAQPRLLWESKATSTELKTYNAYAKEHKITSLKDFLKNGLTLGAQWPVS
jgi:hypothetical protein